MASIPAAAAPSGALREDTALADDWQRIRALSEQLAAPLAAEDQVVQTMPDVSPTKWHLAHVTWFFERFVLQPHLPGYRPWDERWHYLFNSYYQTVGQMHARPRRGLLSRPTVAEVLAYRAHVNAAMAPLLARADQTPELAFLLRLGLNHEQQHQELLLTDLWHVLWSNPLGPAYDTSLAVPAAAGQAAPFTWIERDGGEAAIGASGEGFCFDNETPRHAVRLRPHALANRLVTVAEYRAFIDDGGYREPALWLADGWAKVQEDGWQAPLYWSEDATRGFTLAGWQPLDPEAPVTHLSFYEAEAYARWAGARLPTEAEWESAAAPAPVAGNFLDAGRLHPAPAGGEGLLQLFGDAWEWTASPYLPYPGFRPLAGSLGEYNGKFMCNQLSVRGGSCLSSADHLRASYRSFFYPHQRWQMLGFRLARDLD
jgi:ergothioneine biosynthesis protein EgtB